MKLQPVSSRNAKELHEGGLAVLAETGVRIGCELSREMLVGAGGRVEGEVVKLPAAVVEAALSRCPRQIALAGRDGRRITLGDGTLRAHPSGGCRDVIDRSTRRRRRATLADLEELLRLTDALDQFDITLPLVTPTDVPPDSMMIHSFAAAARHSTKPLASPGLHYAAEVRHVAGIARAVRPGGPPLAVVPVSPISPLNFPTEVCEAMIEATRLGLPVLVLPCPVAGVASPLTLAGTIAQQHAESLAGIVLAQTASPGAAVIYCSRATLMDFHTAESVMGNPEIGLIGACCAQLARRVGLPSDVYGLGTSSPRSDVQAGYEKAINALVSALAGADILSGGGSLGEVVACSHEQLVIDDEILAAVRRVLAGVNVGRDTLALDAIADAAKGEMFVSHKHTVAHLRSGEIWLPAISARGAGDAILHRARARAAELLAGHVVQPLPDEAEAAVRSILADADRELPALRAS